MDNHPPPSPNKYTVTIWVLVIALIVIIIAAVIVLYVIQKQDEKPQTNTTNVAATVNRAATNINISPITLEDLNLTAPTFPKLDSSTSAQPLATYIASQVLDLPASWQTVFDDSKRLTLDANQNSESVTPLISGTHGSYVNLIDDGADLILVAREPSQDELNYAQENNVTLDIQLVAWDAFVFIVNQANNIDGLTTKQIQDIYTGNITDWNEVNGDNETINAYQRNDNSGSQELMMKLVMKNLTMIDAPKMILMSMSGPFDALKTDEQGLGYSVYFYEEFMAPGDYTKHIAVDDVMPNYSTIQSQQYPHTTGVYVVIRGDEPTTSSAYKLRNWLLTDEGQRVVAGSGYVPL